MGMFTSVEVDGVGEVQFKTEDDNCRGLKIGEGDPEWGDFVDGVYSGLSGGWHDWPKGISINLGDFAVAVKGRVVVEVVRVPLVDSNAEDFVDQWKARWAAIKEVCDRHGLGWED